MSLHGRAHIRPRGWLTDDLVVQTNNSRTASLGLQARRFATKQNCGSWSPGNRLPRGELLLAQLPVQPGGVALRKLACFGKRTTPRYRHADRPIGTNPQDIASGAAVLNQGYLHRARR